MVRADEIVYAILLLGWWFTTLWGPEERFIRFGAFATEQDCIRIQERVTSSHNVSFTSLCASTEPVVRTDEQGAAA